MHQQVLRAKQLRRVAGRMAYHDKSMATEDAMLIGRLHTEMPGMLCLPALSSVRALADWQNEQAALSGWQVRHMQGQDCG